jgi:GDP-mannose 6-dehydrogenase
MKISIFGLGYVGVVTAGCLAKRGHTIVGVDVSPQKVESFNAGLPPIVEPGLAGLLGTAKAQQLLRGTTNAEEAIAETELSIVCVGTPSRLTGALDIGFVRGVVQQIAAALRRKRQRHVLVLRSTMLPGSTEQLVREFLSDLAEAGQVQVFYYPEFLREGTAVADFENPSLAVVGTPDGGRPSDELTAALFNCAAVVNWSTAELTK